MCVAGAVCAATSLPKELEDEAHGTHKATQAPETGVWETKSQGESPESLEK